MSSVGVYLEREKRKPDISKWINYNNKNSVIRINSERTHEADQSVEWRDENKDFYCIASEKIPHFFFIFR